MDGTYRDEEFQSSSFSDLGDLFSSTHSIDHFNIFENFQNNQLCENVAGDNSDYGLDTLTSDIDDLSTNNENGKIDRIFNKTSDYKHSTSLIEQLEFDCNVERSHVVVDHDYAPSQIAVLSQTSMFEEYGTGDNRHSHVDLRNPNNTAWTLCDDEMYFLNEHKNFTGRLNHEDQNHYRNQAQKRKFSTSNDINYGITPKKEYSCENVTVTRNSAADYNRQPASNDAYRSLQYVAPQLNTAKRKSARAFIPLVNATVAGRVLFDKTIPSQLVEDTIQLQRTNRKYRRQHQSLNALVGKRAIFCATCRMQYFYPANVVHKYLRWEAASVDAPAAPYFSCRVCGYDTLMDE